MHEQERGTLTGRVALVTGAGRGIGKSIAITLAKAGASVALVARSSDQLSTTASLIEEYGGHARPFPTDVTSQPAVHDLLIQVERQLGPVDLLVNNAGRHHAIGPLWELDPADWWLDIESNLRSTLLCSHAVLSGMVQRRHGCIINISSGAGNEPRPYSSAYSTVKAAVTRFTESLAISTKEYGVDVFAIHPGAVRTELAEYLLQSEPGRRWLPDFERIYSEQEVPPELAAHLALYLASGKASPLSGRFLSVHDDLDALVAHSSTIQQQDLLVLRLRQDGIWA
jgi:NAD(P)-dependent dehydrogenase (short-subunit alcohol dehydrogenase family)